MQTMETDVNPAPNLNCTIKVEGGGLRYGEEMTIEALGALLISPTAPATATSPGTVGQIAFSSGHLYVCPATNTWLCFAPTTFANP